MRRNNFMTDDDTLAALDRIAAENVRRGGPPLSRSEVLRAIVRAVNHTLVQRGLWFSAASDGEALCKGMRSWLGEAEAARQAAIHTRARDTHPHAK